LDSHGSVAVSLEVATVGTGGVPAATPEMHDPLGAIWRSGCNDFSILGRGHHRMSGRTGYLDALVGASWGSDLFNNSSIESESAA